MYRYISFAALLVLFIASAQPATAQQSPLGEQVQSNTENLYLHAHLSGHGVAVDDSDAEGGAGFGVKLGYGFSPLFTAYLGLDGATMRGASGAGDWGDDEYLLMSLDLGTQFNFGAGSRSLVPYIDLALTGQAAAMDVLGETLTMTGVGISGGGGLKYFFSEAVALDAGLSLSFVNYSEVEYAGATEDIDVDATTARLNLGISWYPMR